MGSRPGDRIGIIYGEVDSTEFRFAASDPDIKRGDYVSAQHPSGIVLGQVDDVQRHSQLSFEEAVSMGGRGSAMATDQISCHVKAVGYRDERGLLQLPRTPFKTGTEVRRATSDIVQKVLGLTADRDEGIYLGHLKGTEFPVVLDPEVLVQKHVSVLAKTGAGKSYTVGVLIEELLKRRIAMVIVDPHGEYGTLGSPNIEPTEIDNLVRFKLKPKSFAGQVTPYALEVKLHPGARKLTMDGTGLDGAEILDLLGGKVSSAQQGLLYQAINQVKKVKPEYSVMDVVEEIGRNPSNAKWPLVAALENLDSTGLFVRGGTKPEDLVKPGHAAIISLKGALPQVQEIVVARLARSLFDARKRDLIPPLLLVIEEAHNFAPERGTHQAKSGAELRTIASEGRKFGLGLLVVSQRPAKVDKNVLSQCNTQIIMKVTNPNDLKAISQSVEGLTSEAQEEIQQLGVGICLVSGGKLAVPVLAEVRTRQTRHGGRSVSVVVDEEDAAPGNEAASLPARTGTTQVPLAVEDEAGRPAYAHEQSGPVAEPEPVFGRAQESPEPPAPRVLRRPPPEHIELSTDDAPWAPHAPHPEPSAAEPQEPEPTPFTVHEAMPAPPERKPVRAVRVPREPDAHVAPNLEPDDVALHRVIGRIGYHSAKNSRDAVMRVRDLAQGLPTLSPEDYVRAFARIGRNYCYPSLPECGPCPLLRTCRLGLRRLANGEVREGKWGRRGR